jgi:hypothetical protein
VGRPTRTHRWIALGGSALVALLLGMHGFWCRLPPDAWWRRLLDCLYLSLQLFTLESGNVTGEIAPTLQVARLLAPLVSASAAVAGILALFRDRFQQGRLRRWSGHMIVCGIGSKGLQLVEDLRREGRRVVVIERDEESSALKRCRELGALAVIGDATDSWVLREARIETARRLFATTNDDGTNVEVAVRARDLRASERPLALTGPPLECFVHIRDSKLRARLDARQGRPASAGCRLRFFNVYQDSARLLLDMHPPVAPAGVEASRAR